MFLPLLATQCTSTVTRTVAKEQHANCMKLFSYQSVREREMSEVIRLEHAKYMRTIETCLSYHNHRKSSLNRRILFFRAVYYLLYDVSLQLCMYWLVMLDFILFFFRKSPKKCTISEILSTKCPCLKNLDNEDSNAQIFGAHLSSTWHPLGWHKYQLLPQKLVF
jgi:hypothetical protein